jgi:predicted dehydrogenase
MNNVVIIRGDGGEISLTILGYENAQAQSVDDSNWLRARLEVRGGPFSGGITFAMTTHELALLHRLIGDATKTLTGSVHFQTTEDNWGVNLDFQRNGSAIISGTATPDPGQKNVLHYEFCTDGASLEALVLALGKLVAQYPTKDAVSAV